MPFGPFGYFLRASAAAAERALTFSQASFSAAYPPFACSMPSLLPPPAGAVGALSTFVASGTTSSLAADSLRATLVPDDWFFFMMMASISSTASSIVSDF